MIERTHIQGREPAPIASDLVEVVEMYCTADAPPSDAPNGPDLGTSSNAGGLSSIAQSIG